MSLLFNGFFFSGKFCHLGDKKKTNGSIFLHFLHSFGKKLSILKDFLGHILIKFLAWGQFFFLQVFYCLDSFLETYHHSMLNFSWGAH
jgi:hypothetical protein